MNASRPTGFVVSNMTAGLLRQHAKEHHGNARDAFNLAADRVSCGLSIPDDVRSIIDRALSFTQDRFGK